MFLTHQSRIRLVERLRRLIGGLPCRTQVAALPWRRATDGSCEVMLITSRGTGRWVIPKGWPEGSENLWVAAEREAGEEAGVSGTIDPLALGRFFYMKQVSRDREWRCEVIVYPLQVSQALEDWPERNERRRKWFSPTDAARLVAEPDLAEMIAAFDAGRLKAVA